MTSFLFFVFVFFNSRHSAGGFGSRDYRQQPHHRGGGGGGAHYGYGGGAGGYWNPGRYSGGNASQDWWN